MKYANGAIRITRTPGRKHAKNCINLKDVIDKDHLESVCIYSFFIAEDEIYGHLPLSHSSGGIPVRARELDYIKSAAVDLGYGA